MEIVGYIRNNIVAADSIFGHPAVPGVLSCAAIRASTPAAIENFSSQGPVTMLSGTRQKPDISGIDGVQITGAGGFPNPFYGTSAAAPHIAAIAALLWSLFPSSDAGQIRQMITSSADDLGIAGFDSIYGYGRADALAADARTVTFDPQGGSPVASKTANYNTTLTAPASPTRTGYAFGGWYREPECTTAWSFASDTVTGNITLYAKWMANIYTVSFNSQGAARLRPSRRNTI